MTGLSDGGRATGRRNIMPAAAGNGSAGHMNGFLGGLAEKLNSRGLHVRLLDSAGDSAAIVTNPAAPKRGTVHVGNDGLARWDSGAGALNDAPAAKILDHVTSVLRGRRKEPDDRWAVVDGERLRKLRRQHRLTQQELADKAGVSLWTVGSLERRQGGRCRNLTAALLAVGLEAELASLLCDHPGTPASGPVIASSRRRAGRIPRGREL
jgi:DNA-binding XRE family transcriptional regulator